MLLVLTAALGFSAMSCGGATPQSREPQEPVSEAPSLPPANEVQTRDGEHEVLRGRASYYSDRLAGRSTASGEPYTPSAFTAASRELPFGTMVRVIREDTGASVIVRVNDRGPFGDRRRILDLSRVAAEALDMISAGVVPIRAEILSRP